MIMDTDENLLKIVRHAPKGDTALLNTFENIKKKIDAGLKIQYKEWNHRKDFTLLQKERSMLT